MPSNRFLLLLIAGVVLALPASAPARTLKIATVVPEGSAWVKEMRTVGKEIEQKTQGRVRFKFYPGGVMGNDKTVLRKVRAGQLQGGAFTSGALAQVFPDIELYGLPLVFRDYAEVGYVRERMDEKMIAGLERAGFVALAITDGSFAYLMSQRPVRQVSDLGGAKVWTQEGDIMSVTALEIAGVSPIQLSLSDVYTALQTGLIDTVGAPAMGAIALQWHTKLTYLTDVPLTYLTGAFVIDAKAFAKLEPEDQRVVRETVGAAARRLDEGSREGEESAMRALKAQGIQFVSAATPAEVERWHDITRQATVLLRKQKIYSDAMFDELERLVEEYREGARAERGE